MLTTERKLLLGAMVVGLVTTYLAYLGASTSWQYYLTVDECVAGISSLCGKRVRVGGNVARGSLSIAKDRSSAKFALQGNTQSLQARCSGPIPDNLGEGMEVVVEGRLLDAGWLRGDQVMTRCASKYVATTSSGSHRRPSSANQGASQ